MSSPLIKALTKKKTTTRLRHTMATIRRLSDDDVRSIFEAIHENRMPPHHLQFQIVPVGPDGLKLSPPSLEFEDGLYILLKPQKKKKSVCVTDLPKVPSNLIKCVMEDVLESNCPWSLSGPQFPQPTAIQQRYCYPKGEAEYSSRKGGALWTMYGDDGKENLEYRLLHVYFSAKRAVNKGIKVKSGAAISTPRSQKRYKRSLATPTSHSPPPGMHVTSAPESFEDDEMAFGNGDPFQQNFVTPDTSYFGRFHPVPGNDSPVCHRSTYPWVHQPHELDGFQLSMEEPTLAELEDCWEDPMVPNMLSSPEEDRIHRFGAKLEQIHESIKECILLAAHESERGHLTHMISDWGKQIAMNPIGEVDIRIERV